ncbi:MAG: AAA family ATPase [Xanthobacteraceae bacterium]
MLTRIEISGFKSFEGFGLNLRPLTAMVGPNASGKSNLFDALRFLSLLAQHDTRTAMQDLRGKPEELFRKSSASSSECMIFAIEVLLSRKGTDAFGTTYETPAQRLRYELELVLSKGIDGTPKGVVVRREECFPIAKKDDQANYFSKSKINYNSRVSPFIRVAESDNAIEVRQDGRQKHGRPLRFSLREASRTALSTITTAEFPHLYALRQALCDLRFLEINPSAARRSNDIYEDRVLRPDASNLSAVLARLKDETSSESRANGVLSDIAADLAYLIPSVRDVEVKTDVSNRQYSFDLKFIGNTEFSSRVISDGTLRMLALLSILNDPERRGTLCFEEPENGVHEGRVGRLVEFLRNGAQLSDEQEDDSFQILINTHSPKVMEALRDEEIVAADTIVTVDPVTEIRSSKTRMRTGVTPGSDLFDPEKHLSRFEVEKLLQRHADAA